MDNEIKDSLKNLDNAEKRIGTWKINTNAQKSDPWTSKKDKSNIATEADVYELGRSDPYCDQSGCRTDTMDPFTRWRAPKIPAVPDFGVDHDIKATQQHSENAEKQLNHKWDPKQDEDGNWVVPTDSASFKLS